MAWTRTFDWETYLPIGLVAALGIALTVAAFREVWGWEKHRALEGFRSAARDRILVINRELKDTLGVVQDIGGQFAAARTVQRREFRWFVGPALERYESIKALEWVPRIAGPDRDAFVADARRSFPRFRITELNDAAQPIEAAARPTHFPILYVQPYQDNKDALGFDLASVTTAQTILGEPAVSQRLRITPPVTIDAADQTKGQLIVALWPVYREAPEAAGTDAADTDAEPETPPYESRTLLGYARGVFGIGEIVERALLGLSPGGIDIRIYDTIQPDRQSPLYKHVSRLRQPLRATGPLSASAIADTTQVSGILPVGDQEWLAVCTPVPGHFRVETFSVWTVALGGLVSTFLLTAYLSSLVGRTAKVQRLVAERTVQLEASNVALSNEIAERLRAERELQSLNETLELRVAFRTAESERRAEELEQFAYVTSHDLKAPLRAVSNLAEWVEEDLQDKLTEATREQMALLRDRVSRMQALIDGLLDYSRVGAWAIEVEDVNTEELLAEVVDSLAPPDGFSVHVAPDLPVVRTSRLHLSQVFANLIGNAIKHHGGGSGNVWISAQERDSFYEFTVADDGPGIDPKYHERIFKMFQVLATKDFATHTGIGLAMVKKIVREHGGSIVLESREGEGARFRFTWPVTARP